MHMNRLGHTGLFVSELCLGTMTFGGGGGMWSAMGALPLEGAQPLFQAAHEAGINFYDTADVYSNGISEEITGKALKALGLKRDEYVLATKAFGQMGEGVNQRRHLALSSHGGVQGLAEAPRTGSHRPLSNPRHRRGDADRGDAGGGGHARAPRARPLSRAIQLGGVAHPEGGGARGAAPSGQARVAPSLLYHRRARSGGARSRRCCFRKGWG